MGKRLPAEKSLIDDSARVCALRYVYQLPRSYVEAAREVTLPV